MRVYSELEVVARVAGLTRRRLRRWCQLGLVVPAMRDPAGAPLFAEIDVARVALIRELVEDLGVNETGVEIILDLLDQLHVLRAHTARLVEALGALDPALRRRVASLLAERVG